MAGAVVDLAGLAAPIEWTDDRAALAVRESVAESRAAHAGTDRLATLREWLAATSSRPGPSPSVRFGLRRPRCVVTGTITDRARELAGQLDVPIDTAGGTGTDGSDATDLQRGVGTADHLVDEGCELLIVASGAESPDAAVLVSVLLDLEPVAVLPRGAAAVDTRAWIRAAEHLRDRRRDLIGLRHRPDDLLAALDRPSLSAAAGLIMRAVARRTPVLLDGADAAAAALLCQSIESRAAQWWRFADRSPGMPESIVREELSAEPVLELGTSTGDGVAALLCVAVLRAAALGDS